MKSLAIAIYSDITTTTILEWLRPNGTKEEARPSIVSIVYTPEEKGIAETEQENYFNFGIYVVALVNSSLAPVSVRGLSCRIF